MKKKVFRFKVKQKTPTPKVEEIKPKNSYENQVTAIFRLSPDDRPVIIQAAYMEPGKKYVSHSYLYAIELISKDMRDTSDIREWKIKFKGYSNNGDLVEIDTNGLTPVIINDKVVDEIMQLHVKGVNRMAEKNGSKTKATLKDSKVVRTREVKSAVLMDPKTGCRPGTTAQIVGTIMLKIKEGPEHRKKCLELIKAELIDQGHAEKASSLAASWYSTLVLRKPTIYGKYKAPAKVATSTKKLSPTKKFKLAKKSV